MCDVGCDICDVIVNFYVISELIIGKFFFFYEFIGVDNWFGVMVYWCWNCL